jgi:hypothetical protein
LVACAYGASLVPIAFILLIYSPPRASTSAPYWTLLICLVFGIALGILGVIQEAHNFHDSQYVLSSVYVFNSITLFLVPIEIDSTLLFKLVDVKSSRRIQFATLAVPILLKFVRIGISSAFLSKVHSGVDGFETGEYINLGPWKYAAALRLGTYCLQFVDNLYCSSLLLLQGYRSGYVNPMCRLSSGKTSASWKYFRATIIAVFGTYVIPLGLRIALIATDDRSKVAYNQGAIVTLATSTLQYSNFHFSLYSAIVAMLCSPVCRPASDIVKSDASYSESSSA